MIVYGDLLKIVHAFLTVYLSVVDLVRPTHRALEFVFEAQQYALAMIHVMTLQLDCRLAI